MPYLTYGDCLSTLVDYFGGSPDDLEQRVLRNSVVTAYRETTQAANWSYLTRKHRIQLQPVYSTGTITYTSSTRTVTLASGTWPSWAASGEIQVDGIVSQVSSRTSDSVIVLDSTNCFNADIAAGTSYVLFQSSYLLPEDFLSMSWPHGEQTGVYSCYLTPEEWFAMERHAPSSADPYLWTIFGAENQTSELGRMALWVYPYPSTARTHDFLIRRAARSIRRSGFESASTIGTIAISAGSTAVVGTSTLFTANMVGSVIRLTDDTTYAPDGAGGIRPYLEEFVIASVTDTTHLTLAAATTYAYTGTKYRISDPLDIERTMFMAVLRRAEYELAVLTHQSNAVIDRSRGAYVQELRLAMENDLKHPTDGGGIQDDDYSDGWSSGIDYTVNL